MKFDVNVDLQTILTKDVVKTGERVRNDKDIIFDYYEYVVSSIHFNLQLWVIFPSEPTSLQIVN